MAFPVSRNSIISSIAAYFSNTSALTIATPVAITATLYSASSVTSNIFNPIPGATITLSPVVSGNVLAGTVYHGIASLNVSVPAETRLLLVFSIRGTIATTITGFASASITIN